MFQLNQRVCLINNQNQKGRVIDVLQNNLYEIEWDNQNIEIVELNDLQEITSEPTPWDKLINNEFLYLDPEVKIDYYDLLYDTYR